MGRLRRLGILCILAGVCLGLAAGAAAGDLRQVTGKVKDVDLAEQSIVVGSGETDLLIYLDKETSVLVGGKAGGLEDVGVGSVVIVEFYRTGEDMIASEIRTGP